MRKKNPHLYLFFFFDKVGGGLLHCEAYKKKIILIKLFNLTTED